MQGRFRFELPRGSGGSRRVQARFRIETALSNESSNSTANARRVLPSKSFYVSGGWSLVLRYQITVVFGRLTVTGGNSA